jgi:hypothetical protein
MYIYDCAIARICIFLCFLTSAAAKYALHQGSSPLQYFFYVPLAPLLISNAPPFLQAAAAARLESRFTSSRPSIVSLCEERGDPEILRDMLLVDPAVVHEYRFEI